MTGAGQPEEILGSKRATKATAKECQPFFLKVGTNRMPLGPENFLLRSTLALLS